MSLYSVYTHNTTSLQNGISNIQIRYIDSNNNTNTINLLSGYYSVRRIVSQYEIEYNLNIQITENHKIVQCPSSNNNNSSVCRPDRFSILIYGSSISSVLAVQIDFNINNIDLFYTYVRDFFIEIKIKIMYNRNRVDNNNIIITISPSYWNNRYIDYTYKRKYADFSDIFNKSLTSFISKKTIIENSPRYTGSVSDLFNNWDHVPFIAVQDKTFVHNHESDISDKVVKTYRNKYTANFKISSITDRDVNRLYDYIEDPNSLFLNNNRNAIYVNYPIGDNNMLKVFHASYMALTRTGAHKLFYRADLKHLYHNSDIFDLEGASLEIVNKRYLSITPKIYVSINTISNNTRTDVVLDFIIQHPNGTMVRYGGTSATGHAVVMENFDISEQTLILVPIDMYMLIVGRSTNIAIWQSIPISVIYEEAMLNKPMNDSFELISFNDLMIQNNFNMQPLRIKLKDIYLPHNIVKLNSGNTSFGANTIIASSYEVTRGGGGVNNFVINRRLNIFLFPFYKILYHSKNITNSQGNLGWMRPRYELFYRHFIQ